MDNNIRLEQDNLYKQAKVWLENCGTLDQKFVESNGLTFIRLTLTTDKEKIVRDGEDIVHLTIALYNELHN